MISIVLSLFEQKVTKQSQAKVNPQQAASLAAVAATKQQEQNINNYNPVEVRTKLTRIPGKKHIPHGPAMNFPMSTG